MKKKFLLWASLFCFSLILNACTSAKAEELEEDSIARLDEVVEGQEVKPTVHQVGQARYEDYNAARFTQLKGKKPFVLFFYANWCPSCRLLDKQLIENLGTLGSAVILKTDYETALDLRKEYGVTVQTTMLVFNRSGEVVQKKINPSLSLVQEFFKKSY